jgi:hypothetical protein
MYASPQKCSLFSLDGFDGPMWLGKSEVRVVIGIESGEVLGSIDGLVRMLNDNDNSSSCGLV